MYQPRPSIGEAMREVRTKSQLAKLLAYLHIRPSKSLGQNFLVDHNLLEAIVREAEVGRNDLVLDIGCGTGLLTAHLADAAGHVIGIELHRGLFAVCSRYLEGRENVTLLCGDALASKHALSPALLDATRTALATGRFTGLRVVSNLPYCVASLLIPNLLESGLPIAVMVVTVQKEVGQRLAAAQDSPDFGALSLLVQVHGRVEVLRWVPPEVFWPRPKVASCIVRVRPGPGPKDRLKDLGAFRALVRAAFAHRRKTLANSLAASKLVADPAALLAICGIAPNARAQDLPLEDYVRLANELAPAAP